MKSLSPYKRTLQKSLIEGKGNGASKLQQGEVRTDVVCPCGGL